MTCSHSASTFRTSCKASVPFSTPDFYHGKARQILRCSFVPVTEEACPFALHLLQVAPCLTQHQSARDQRSEDCPIDDAQPPGTEEDHERRRGDETGERD